MPVITIGLNNEVLGVNTYDVFVSNCVNPPLWTQVADDITFSQFPQTFLDSVYGITGTCYTYLVSGDTGCSCEGTGYTVSPSVTPTMTVTPSITPSITPSPVSPSVTPTITATPSITPTITPSISVTPTITPSISMTPTPTPSPLVCDEISFIETSGPGIAEKNVFDQYMTTSGSLQYISICDAFGCSQLDANDIGMLKYQFTGDTYIPTSGLSQSLTGVTTPLQKSDCNQWTSTDFYNSIYWSGTGINTSPSQGDEPLYFGVTGTSGTSIYEITSSGGNMFATLYATCDFTGVTEPIVGIEISYNSSGQWVIDGQNNPDITLNCNQLYHFHICNTGLTGPDFVIATDYDIYGTDNPAFNPAGVSDGVTSNEKDNGTIVVQLSDSGDDGGFWYGTAGTDGALGRIYLTDGC